MEGELCIEAEICVHPPHVGSSCWFAFIVEGGLSVFSLMYAITLLILKRIFKGIKEREQEAPSSLSGVFSFSRDHKMFLRVPVFYLAVGFY